MDRSKPLVSFSYLFLCLLFFMPASQAQVDEATRKLSYNIFKQLIEIKLCGFRETA